MTDTEKPVASFKVKVEMEIDFKMISNLLVTAFEGGSNSWIERISLCAMKGNDSLIEEEKQIAENLREHWCNDSLPSKVYTLPFTRDGFVTVVIDEEFEDGKGRRFRLGKSEIEKGLSLMAEAYSKHFSDFIEENDDADTADTFLQLCLFGEVVFG
jgi:hypothetical protein